MKLIRESEMLITHSLSIPLSTHYLHFRYLCTMYTNIFRRLLTKQYFCLFLHCVRQERGQIYSWILPYFCKIIFGYYFVVFLLVPRRSDIYLGGGSRRHYVRFWIFFEWKGLEMCFFFLLPSESIIKLSIFSLRQNIYDYIKFCCFHTVRESSYISFCLTL